MNTTQTNYGFTQGGSGNTVAFLFGAVFNILANTDYASFLDYSIKAVIGGVIMMLFKLLGDYISKLVFNRKKNDRIKKHSGSLKLRKRKKW